MKKTTKLFILIVTALLALSLTACEEFLIGMAEGLMSVSGKAINVMAAATQVDYWKGTSTTSTQITMEGAIITLTPTDATLATKTATVGSDGTWLVTGIAQGTYKVTGVKSGWTFIPAEIEVTGLLQNITSDLLAYPDQGAEAILLIVKWNNPAIDVDAQLVIDDGIEDFTAGKPVVRYGDAYDQYPTTGTAAVSLDRDVRFDSATDTTLSSPQMLETIRIISNPFGTGNSGWLRFYLNSYAYINNNTYTLDASTGTLTGNPDDAFKGRAGATVYIMQGNTFWGAWPMPVDTAEHTLGVIKIEVTGSSTETAYTFYSYGNNGSAGIRDMGLNVIPVAVDAIR